jgi:hypothetical protein
VQAFASLGKNQVSYLADSVDLVPEKRCTPIAIPKSLVRIRTLLLNYLKLYFMYDTFLVPPLSAGNHTHIRTYRFKKCRSEWLGRRVRLG